MSNNESLHTISLFVANKPGVLLRTTIVFARRGFNIESLVVSSAFDGKYSRMTITAKGDDKVLDQIVKQLAKLVDVIEAKDNRNTVSIERELALIKIDMKPEERRDLLQEVDHFKAKTVDLTNESIIIEISGDSEKVESFLELVKKYTVVELVRSGKMAIERSLTKGK
jgi:acetolactate synthase-1/3 small subunit